MVFAFACDKSLKRILVVQGQRTLYRYSAGTNSVQKDQLTSFASGPNTVLPEYMQQQREVKRRTNVSLLFPWCMWQCESCLMTCLDKHNEYMYGLLVLSIKAGDYRAFSLLYLWLCL